LIQSVDVGSARPGGVKGEPAQKAEAIEDLGIFRQVADQFVIDLLVQ